MAESAIANLPVDLAGAPAPPLQKRKRGAGGSPESYRNKRTAPAPAPLAAMSEADVATSEFIANALSHVQAATVGQDHVNVADFSALQQATVEPGDAADPANASSTAAAALGSMFPVLPVLPVLHVPQSTEETFAAQVSAEVDDHNDTTYDLSAADGLDGVAPAAPMHIPNGIGHEPRYNAGNPKPAVGSEEWHKLRKDNHKEVERRRRETINEGINELAKIVPGCEKNKGSILARAVSFITQLKENEKENIEKWTLEKLLTEQAINELSASNDKFKQELTRICGELEMWKGRAEAPKEEPDIAAA